MAIALDGMRTLAHSPRYWEKYLALLRNPFARLIDLLVIKQGEKIAHQKGWKLPAGSKATPKAKAKAPAKKRRGVAATGNQPSLFD